MSLSFLGKLINGGAKTKSNKTDFSEKHPDHTARISFSVDSSASHMGAVLQQEIAGSWAPLNFFSRKLSSVESRNSAFDRELLAAYSAIPHFWFLLEGKMLVLFSTNP